MITWLIWFYENMILKAPRLMILRLQAHPLRESWLVKGPLSLRRDSGEAQPSSLLFHLSGSGRTRSGRQIHGHVQFGAWILLCNDTQMSWSKDQRLIPGYQQFESQWLEIKFCYRKINQTNHESLCSRPGSSSWPEELKNWIYPARFKTWLHLELEISILNEHWPIQLVK